MPLTNFKINGNQLFSPSVLLLIIFFTFQVSHLEFKNSYDTYSYLLAGAVIVYIVKSFILTFASLEKFLSEKKWILLLSNLILFVLESWLAWTGARELTIDSYPKYTIGALLVATICSYLQVFIIKVPNMFWPCLVNLAIYSILFVLLLTSAFNGFIGNSQLLITFQQITGYLALGMEFVMLFLIGRYFVKSS